jgi:hypothetical protein
MRAMLLLLVCWAALHAAEPAWYAVAIQPPGTAAPGTPVWTIVGGLQCGLRLNNGTQAQAWCFDSTGTTLIYNAVGVVGSSETLPYGTPEFSTDYYEPAITRATSIRWAVWVPIDGAPVNYQIWSTACLSCGWLGIWQQVAKSDGSTIVDTPTQSGTIQ